MTIKPLISIVTPSYNQGKYLEETILSFINQSYPNKELIIIDGGSSDNTIEVIKKYEKHIKYWVSEPDKGQTDAIIKGVNKCEGDIFNWINSDDRLHEGSLEEVADLYMKNDAPDLIAGPIQVFNDTKNLNIFKRINFWDNMEKTLGMGQMCQPGMFYKTAVVKRVGLNPAYHYSMDVDLFYRFNFFNETQRIVYTDKLLADFRLHEDSKTVQEINNSSTSLFLKERLKILCYYSMKSGSKRCIKKISELSEVENIEYADDGYRFINRFEKKLYKSINYFLYGDLLEAIYIFDKIKIKKLIFSINWFTIELPSTIRVVKHLANLFRLFIQNLFRKTITQ